MIDIMCIQPYYISNRKYTGYVPCGKCVECIEKRSKDWQFRAEQEFKLHPFAYFLTLTYNMEHLPLDGTLPVLNKRDLQLFFKRLRKRYGTFRYFALGEYGPTTHRPHYHVMLFFDTPFCDYFKTRDDIAAIWSNGFIALDELTFPRISYTVGYMCPSSELSPEYRDHPPFTLISVGFGRGYLTESRVQFYRNLLKDAPMVRQRPFSYIQDKYKISLPRYYRNRIYTLAEKAEIKHCIAYDLERKGDEAVREFEAYERSMLNLNFALNERWYEEFFGSSSSLARERANRLANEEKRKQKLIKKRKL